MKHMYWHINTVQQIRINKSIVDILQPPVCKLRSKSIEYSSKLLKFIVNILYMISPCQLIIKTNTKIFTSMNFLYINFIKRQTYAVCCTDWKKNITCLSKLSVSLLVLNHVSNSCKHKFASVLSFLPSLSNINTLVSSAYSFTFACGTVLQMSLIYIRNKSGPNTEPWGSP